MSVGGLRDVGGPRAHLPSNLRSGQQRNRAQPSGPILHRQPQRYLLLVHRVRLEQSGSAVFKKTTLMLQISVGSLRRPNYYLLPPTDTPQTCVIHVTQLERDTILVCLDSEKLIFAHFKLLLCSLYFCNSQFLPLVYYLLFCRMYKDSEPPRATEIQQEVISRAHLQLSD